MTLFAFHAPTPDMLQVTDEGYVVRLCVRRNLNLERAWVRTEPDNEQFLSPLEVVGSDASWLFWQGVLRLNTAEDVTLYCFKLELNGRQFWLDGTLELKRFFPERQLHFRVNPHYLPVRWIWSQVFYQIFPDRFFDGDASNNVQSGEYLYEAKPVVAKAWGALPDSRQGPREFYGGDLEGIRLKLDYLQGLGVTALYLNPIFESPSSHKYDTVDFCEIDKHLGTKEVFVQLCDDLKHRNMRIFLDAVVNHTSERHVWFDRYGEHEQAGAYQSESSDSREFYVFESDDPESYQGWFGVKTLPVLDYKSEKLRDIVYRNDDAILRYWLRPPYAVDGWRFDVIHMLGEGSGALNNANYVRHFRQTLKEENSEAFMLGEHFFEATKWLQGDQEDGAMNYYGFTSPLWAFLANKNVAFETVQISAEDFDYLLMRARVQLPFELQLSQFNLLGSHDTPRFLSFVGADVALMKLAVLCLFSYIGVPCVYYGDEVGLEGLHDPDCRRTFPWNEDVWNQDLKQHYETLIAFRKNHKVLQEGSFLSLYAQDDVYVFARVLNESKTLTILNRGDTINVTLDAWKLGLNQARLKSLFDDGVYEIKGGLLHLELAAKQGLFLYL